VFPLFASLPSRARESKKREIFSRFLSRLFLFISLFISSESSDHFHFYARLLFFCYYNNNARVENNSVAAAAAVVGVVAEEMRKWRKKEGEKNWKIEIELNACIFLRFQRLLQRCRVVSRGSYLLQSQPA
jgi:hypothetical protein